MTGGLGKPEKVNGEYQFSLDLAKVTNDERNATVKIYVSATSHNLTYDANGGTLADGSYSKDKVYPKMELTLPTDAEITREGYRFDVGTMKQTISRTRLAIGCRMQT